MMQIPRYRTILPGFSASTHLGSTTSLHRPLDNLPNVFVEPEALSS